MKKFNLRFSIVAVAIIISVGLVCVNAQEGSTSIEDRPITIELTDKPVLDVFMRLIHDYDIPIGYEESTLDFSHNDYHFETNIPFDEVNTPTTNGQKRLLSGARSEVKNHLITLKHRDAKLRDVMNDIIDQMQNYRWEICDGVVNIIPARGRDPRFEKLMALRIDKFEVPKGSEVKLLQSLIFYLPEFRRFLDENDLNVDYERVAPWYDGRPLPAGMKFSELTLRELLNNITRSKRGGWILRINKHRQPIDLNYIDILI